MPVYIREILVTFKYIYAGLTEQGVKSVMSRAIREDDNLLTAVISLRKKSAVTSCPCFIVIMRVCT